MSIDFFLVLITFPVMLVAVVLHELAHGWVAEKLGDPTARAAGRISLNPLVHIDLTLTILLPALLLFINSPVVFGGAKPIPVNSGYFRNPRLGMTLVALAGPAVNFLLLFTSLIGYICFAKTTPGSSVIGYLPESLQMLILGWIYQGIIINLVLALFNLTPIPPLDGGRVAVGLLPVRAAQALSRLEPYGLPIVFLLLYSGALDRIISPAIALVSWVIS